MISKYLANHFKISHYNKRITNATQSSEGTIKSSEKNKKCFLYIVKLLYIIFLAALVLALAVETYQCAKRYLSEPTYYKAENVPQNETKFPDITICSNVPGGIRGPGKENFRAFRQKRNFSAIEIFNMSYFDLKDLVSKVIVETRNDRKRLEIFNGQLLSDIVTWKKQKSLEFGKCYTIKFGRDVLEAGVSSVTIM